MKTYLIIPYLLFLLSCNTDKIKIFRINIASGISHARFPAQAVQIDSTLYYQYFGGEFSNPKGYYYGRYDKKSWRAIIKASNEVNWDELKNTKSVNYEDWPIEIILYYSKGRKHIKTYYEHLPIELKKVVEQLLESHKRVELVKSAVKLEFETNYQNPYPGPTKFPPTTK
jgi:hypothetical protein